MTEDYIYQPVPDNSIRVLRLRPARTYSAPISCTLQHISLNSNAKRIPYEAVSYVWGSPIATVPVLCDGAIVHVTENGEDALRRFRRKTRSRNLWLDAICINQGDLEDRNKQVPLMGRVYKLARRVLVWLGSGRVPSSICRLTSTLSHLPLPPNWASLPMDILFSIKVEDMLYELGDIWDKSEWASRAWTLQEFLFAKDFCIYQDRSKVSRRVLRKEYIADSLLPPLINTPMWFTRLKPFPQGFDTYFNLCLMGATDPRDRMFSVYSLLGYADHLPPPDYHKPPGRVYHETVVGMIKVDRHLSYSLLMRPRSYSSPDLPSWIPDFSDSGAFGALDTAWRLIVRWRCDAHFRYAAAAKKIDINESFAVSNEAVPSPILNLKGIILGTINKIGEDFPKTPSSLTDAHLHQHGTDGNAVVAAAAAAAAAVPAATVFTDSVDSAGSSTSDSSGSTDAQQAVRTAWAVQNFHFLAHIIDSDAWEGVNLLDGFFAITAFDGALFRDPFHPTEKLLKDDLSASAYETWIKHNIPDWHRYVESFILARELPSALTDLPFADRPPWAPGHAEYPGNLSGMRCFTLDTSFFGIGHSPVLPGDIVAIAKGFSMAVVLRSAGEKWTFMGAAIVPGVMYGEKWPEDTSCLQTFAVI